MVDNSITTQNSVGDTSLNLGSITDGANARGIPKVLFLEDIEDFAASFKPAATPELLIGAYSELFSKFKAYETNLTKKRMTYQQKIPEIEKTLGLVCHLKEKHDAGDVITTQVSATPTRSKRVSRFNTSDQPTY